MRQVVIVCVLAAGVVAHAQPAPAPESVQLDRAAAEQTCAAHEPTCDWLATLGSLERASVRRGLAKRGYEVDPMPWGKVIGHVRIYNEDVFEEGGRLIELLNFLHFTTREGALRDEVVVQSGEVWDEHRIQETARRLRDPLWSSVVAVVPVKSSEPGKVDVLVVTRDVWSLRLNTKYTYQQGKLTDLSLSLSENNFFGTRNVVAASVLMDQGAIAVGPLFLDQNVAGQHIALSASVRDILNRDDLLAHSNLRSEGTTSSISVAKTLWSLASEWGYGASFSHRFAIDRQFTGTQLRQVRCAPGEPCHSVRASDPPAPPEELLPWIYGIHRLGTTAYLERQWGTDLKQQLTFGHTLDSVRPRLLDDFAGTREQAAAFAAAVFPRSERTSVLYVAHSLFTPRYRTRRNVQTYDLAEDVRDGPFVDSSFGVGLKVIGSEANFERGGLSAGWTIPWCRDGSVSASSGVSFRYQDGKFIDNTASMSARIVTPLWPQGRFVAEATAATRWNDTQNASYGIGGDPSLRGFAINQFRGQRLFGAQIEARSRSWAVWVVRVGGLVFYDVGGASDSFKALSLHHDAGIGFRMLIPQTSRELFRFDVPVPLDGPDRGRPRFIASFNQAF